jgi:hypothetical protein
VRSFFFPLCWSGRGRWPDTITSHVLVLCTHDTLLPLYAPTHCSVPSTASVIESSSFPQWQAHARAGARPCLYITHTLSSSQSPLSLNKWLALTPATTWHARSHNLARLGALRIGNSRVPTGCLLCRPAAIPAGQRHYKMNPRIATCICVAKSSHKYWLGLYQRIIMCCLY